MTLRKLIERRKVILAILCLVILSLLLMQWVSGGERNEQRTSPVVSHVDSSEEINIWQKLEDYGLSFGPKKFDDALLINGPKLSQFETNNDKNKSIELVKSVAAESFNHVPIPDEKIDSDSKPVEYYLQPGLIPPEIHFLWCRGGNDRPKKTTWFEYKNYLTVNAALRSMQPDKIFIHMESMPQRDRTIYHQWLDALKADYPWLYLLNMTTEQVNSFCISAERSQKMEIIFSILNEVGGIFVGENTWMLNYPPINRAIDFDFALHFDPDGTTDGFVMMRAGMYGTFLKQFDQNQQGKDLSEKFLEHSIQGFRSSSSESASLNSDFVQSLSENPVHNTNDKGESRTRHSSCFRVQQLHDNERLRNISKCVVVRGGAFDSFYPMDIWQLDSPFGRLSRKLFYGSERVRLPKPKYDTLVPNIAHMIWIGGREMDYVFFLSVLSLLFVAEVKTVYIHGDIEPPGYLWRKLMMLSQTKDRIKFITRTQPHLIYQEEVEKGYYSLMSDLIRVDLMIKYGGIYTDTDAIWVKPLSLAERGYDAVASYDWIDWSWPFQDTVNFGISYGKRDAPFWRIFRDSMRKLYNDVHGFTGVMMPYKLLEKYPELLRIDRRLSVICYHSKCHPTYYPGYHDEKRDHTNTNSIPNWKEDVHAFHWTHPNPPELFNKTTLMKSQGIFAELGRNVLKKANLL